ncbi:GMC family oxidoreductase N-terminal domain-containing protein [Streptomyces asiaticus]
MTKAVRVSLLSGAVAGEAFAEASRFRDELHACLTARGDALFELSDAVLCAPGAVHSVVELTLLPEHQRGHGAMYDGLNQGRIDIDGLRSLLAGLPQLGGRRIYLPRGRAIGGTSSMNTMLYVRGHRYDYDTWERMGNPGWGYDDVLPFFKKSEDNQRGADDFHGTGGPLTVSDPVSVHPLLTAWVEAAQDAGRKSNPDFNGTEQDGVGYHQVTQRNALRCSSAVAFLEPAADRPNLTVLPSTTALRLSFDGTRAQGLDVDHLGSVRLIRISREVVLSLGAYNSPHLLLQSGVGPADELAQGGITPLHDLPDVGRNMQDHAGCFISFFSHTEGLAAPLEPGMSFGPYVARPSSRGSVHLRHSHPYAKPRIVHNYLGDEDDRRRLREGLRICMRIAGESRLTEVLESDLHGAAAAGLAPVSDRDQDIDDFIHTQSFSFYHPSGTCMMGKVVDSELRVRGLDNVRVADTSIMPSLVTGNTNAPAIMIGERAASFIRSAAR